MDPDAALATIRDQLAAKPNGPEEVEQALEGLQITVDGLIGWLDSGGSLPAAWRHHAQFHRLGELVEQHKATGVGITYAPFDLPAGWIMVTLQRDPAGNLPTGGLTYGIDPDGRASS